MNDSKMAVEHFKENPDDFDTVNIIIAVSLRLLRINKKMAYHTNWLYNQRSGKKQII